MKDIAVDKADFEGIIKNDLIYVDKTKYLHNIVSGTKTYFFLSRPRRFGKSLTISTLKYIFEGKKELFKGLYIENTDWKWEVHPIVHLDFNEITSTSIEIFKEDIGKRLLEISKKYSVELTEERTERKIRELIIKLYEKYQKGVVFLVDEYDKPIVDHLSNEEEIKIARENQDFMKVFYNNLKPLEVYLKTVFITGVSKFSKVSIFSTLNNLYELDTHVDYAGMLGYTEDELTLYFSDHFREFSEMEGVTLEEIRCRFKTMYNGFRFTEKDLKVYNPFSIGRAFSYKKIGNYWFESGTPTFLINLIKRNEYDFKEIGDNTLSLNDIKAYDIDNLHVTALLYQTGYLTIKDYMKFGKESEIVLDFPNDEVKDGFFNQLLSSYVEKDDFSTSVIISLRKALLLKDFNKFIILIKSIYAGIPYLNNVYAKTKNGIADYEFHYHNVFYVIITLLSDSILKISSEVMTSEGRIDCVIEMADTVYIIEVKCNQSAEKAINQIKSNKYYEKYEGRYESINIIGINFSSKFRNIDDWKIEKI